MTLPPHPKVFLFGAFDRHNFGDLLFPHVVTSFLGPQRTCFLGLLDRDLRDEGGHRVTALAKLPVLLGDGPAHLIHVGGELLTCNAWEAAVMLSPAPQADAAAAQLDHLPQAARRWAQQMLGRSDRAPYTLGRGGLPGSGVKVFYHAVGGVDLARRPPALRKEVLAKLAEADDVSVRDQLTLSCLQSAGIAARLIPDPAVMVAERYGVEIWARAAQGEVARACSLFGEGYLAVQFSADFGDDATLEQLARQLDHLVAGTGLGIVFFRAGAAPCHDDLSCYRRLAARMRSKNTWLFTSLHLWDICCLIASSKGYIGSSLHGRIVATAFGLPRLNLHQERQTAGPTKPLAYATTWEPATAPFSAAVPELARAAERALAVGSGDLEQLARALPAAYRAEWQVLRNLL